MADSQMYVVKRNGKKQESAKFGGEKFEKFEAVDLEVEELKLWFLLPGRFVGQKAQVATSWQ